MRPRSFLGAALAIGVLGCGLGRHHPEPPVPLRSPTRDSLLAADLARSDSAARRGVVAAAGDWLSDQVVYLRAGAPVGYGRDAALALLAAASTDSRRYRWEPLGGAVARDGRTGYTFGIAACTPATASDSASVRLSRYIAYWRRNGDGRWQIAAYSELDGPRIAPGQGAQAADRPRSMALTGRRAEASEAARLADSAFADLAEREGVAAAFSSYVAPLGVIFNANELVIGPDQVRALFESRPLAGTLNWQPILADAAESGDLAMTVGEYVLTGRGPTGAVRQRFGKYLTIWHREPDGSWKFLIDGGSPSPAPPR